MDLSSTEDPGRSLPARIAVIGTGYVGLTVGACFAHMGNRVVCADVDEAKVARLSVGEVPIREEGLTELVEKGLASGRLSFVVGAAAAAVDCDFAYLCVPTPEARDGSVDLTYLRAAAAEIGPVLEAGAVVVNKSTVPVGSTRVVEAAMGRDDVAVVSNPEFLREGTAVQDFINPSRVVIGSDDAEAAQRVASLFRAIDAPVIITDPASAETIKYASNAFLATKVSFVNAVANACEAVGADVGDVLLGMGYDSRIGFEFLKPGPGWGGSCFPKDVIGFMYIAEQAGYDFGLLRGVVQVNREQFERVAAKVEVSAGGSLDGVRVAALGLTFKASTDDLRDSPALAVIGLLRQGGATVAAYDPAVSADSDDPRLAGIELAADPYAACTGAAVVVVLTEWDEFRHLDLTRLAEVMAGSGLVDARNLLEPPAARRAGFHYVGVGR